MRYLLLSVLVVCVIGVMVPSAFAVNESTITVQNAPGSSVPGCEETNGCFIPNRITVDPGDIIMWTNPDTVSHFVTGCTPSAWLKRGVPGGCGYGDMGPFDSGIIMPGQTFSVRLTETGIYNYFCTAHPWMEGAVIVREGIDWTPQSSSSSVPTSKTPSKLILDPLPTTFNVKGSDSGADVTFSGLLVTAPQLSQPSAYIISGATITLKFTGFKINGEDHYKITTDDNGKFNKKFTIPIGNDYGIRAVFEGAWEEVLAPTKSQTEYFRVVQQQSIQPQSPTPSSQSPTPSSQSPTPSSQSQLPEVTNWPAMIFWMVIIAVIVGVVVRKIKRKKKTPIPPIPASGGGKRRKGKPGTSGKVGGATAHQIYECPDCKRGNIEQNPNGSSFCPNCGWKNY